MMVQRKYAPLVHMQPKTQPLTGGSLRLGSRFIFFVGEWFSSRMKHRNHRFHKSNRAGSFLFLCVFTGGKENGTKASWQTFLLPFQRQPSCHCLALGRHLCSAETPPPRKPKSMLSCSRAERNCSIFAGRPIFQDPSRVSRCGPSPERHLLVEGSTT